MRPSLDFRAITASILLFSLAHAQGTVEILEFGSGQLPECAKNCVPLQQAQTGCIPPAAPVTQPAIYKSCFCQSALLITLYSSPNGVCDAFCTSPADLNQVKTWYTSYCASTALPADASTPPAATTSKPKTATSPLSTATRAAANTGPAPSWLDGHWRYVVLIVFLVLAIGGGAIAAVMWKRHRRRKAAALNNTAEPIAWGPFQAQHHTNGIDYVDSYEGSSERVGEKRGRPTPVTREVPQTSHSELSQSRWSDSSNKWWKRRLG